VRTSYGNFNQRARRLASALIEMGLQPGDRVASMMWNHSGHLEAFFGVPCAGGILHTLNLRLHPQEIAAIARHAEDRFLIIDDVLLPVLEKFRADVSFEEIIVAPYGCGEVPSGFLNYEELLANASPDVPVARKLMRMTERRCGLRQARRVFPKALSTRIAPSSPFFAEANDGFVWHQPVGHRVRSRRCSTPTHGVCPIRA